MATRLSNFLPTHKTAISVYPLYAIDQTNAAELQYLGHGPVTDVLEVWRMCSN